MDIIAGVAAVVVLIFSASVLLAPSRSYYKKWPAIDDDEFMRRCPQGTNREIALRVRQIVAHTTGEDYEHVHPQQPLADIFKLR